MDDYKKLEGPCLVPQQSRLIEAIEGLSDEALHAVFVNNTVRKHEEKLAEFKALLDLPFEKVDADLKLKARRYVDTQWNEPEVFNLDELFSD